MSMIDTDSGRAPSGQATQASPEAANASSPSGEYPSREMLFSRKEVAGVLAMWAVRQSPYIVPDNLEAAIASTFDALPDDNGDWFFATEDQLRQMVEFICLNDQSIVAWNTPKSGHGASIVFSSRYDGPAPDDDFIDLHALAGNVCRTLLEDREQYTSDSDGNLKGEDGTASSRSDDSAGRKASPTPDRAALNEGEGE